MRQHGTPRRNPPTENYGRKCFSHFSTTPCFLDMPNQHHSAQFLLVKLHSLHLPSCSPSDRRASSSQNILVSYCFRLEVPEVIQVDEQRASIYDACIYSPLMHSWCWQLLTFSQHFRDLDLTPKSEAAWSSVHP